MKVTGVKKEKNGSLYALLLFYSDGTWRMVGENDTLDSLGVLLMTQILKDVEHVMNYKELRGESCSNEGVLQEIYGGMFEFLSEKELVQKILNYPTTEELEVYWI